MKDCKEKIHMNILCKFHLQEMMQAINRLMQEVSNQVGANPSNIRESVVQELNCVQSSHGIEFTIQMKSLSN